MRNEKPRHPQRDRLVGGALSAVSALLAPFSWRFAQRSGRAIGRLAWHLSRRDRNRALDHLALAFPAETAVWRRRVARGCFLHHGTNLAECLLLLHRSSADLEGYAVVEGWEEVEATRRAGRPILILTGHCGNWELLAALINVRGLGMKVVAREIESPHLNRLLLALRARFGTGTIERGGAGAARQLLSTLRGGGALGMLIDQDTPVDGVWVPFFGRPSFTPVGAARIAAKLGAAVIPAFIERRADGTHLARFYPALDLPADETAATAAMTAVIERQVRRAPEQWVWWHKRWRRQPPAG